MTITLMDGTVLTPLTCIGGPQYIQGASRDTLEFAFDSSVNLIDLDEAFSEENCERIIIENEGVEAVHKGYTIRAALKKEKSQVTPATPDTEAEYAERVIVSMSQRTYAETQIKNLLVSQADQDEVLAELMFA